MTEVKSNQARTAVMSRVLYQKRIPLVLVCILIIIFLVQYFAVPIGPVTSTTAELTKWAAIIASATIIYSELILILANIRVVMERNERRSEPGAGRRLFRAFCYFGGLLFFIGLGLTTPSLETGATYALVFGIIIAGIGLATNTRWLELCWGGLTTFRVTNIETVAMFIVAVFEFLRESSLITYFAPWTGVTGTLLMDTFHVAAQRAALGAAAVGTLALAIRALVMREPGLIETEAI
jgi:hypothetical protein